MRRAEIVGAALLSLFAAAASPLAAQERPANLNLRGLGIHPEDGFRLFQSLNYLIDPSLRDREAPLYDSIETVDALKDLLADSARGRFPRAWDVVYRVFDDFFQLISDNRTYKQDLESVVKIQGGLRQDILLPLCAVGVAFAVKSGGEGEDPGDSSGGERLECRVEFRLFVLRISPTARTVQEENNITYCELLYQDAATGTARLADYSGRPAEALQSALIDALRNRLAVSLCLNPRLNPRNLVEKPPAADLTGPALAVKKGEAQP